MAAERGAGQQHGGEDQRLRPALARRPGGRRSRRAPLRGGGLLRGRGVRGGAVERRRHGVGRGAARHGLVPLRRPVAARGVPLHGVEGLPIRGDAVHLSLAQLNKTVSFRYDDAEGLTQGL